MRRAGRRTGRCRTERRTLTRLAQPIAERRLARCYPCAAPLTSSRLRIRVAHQRTMPRDLPRLSGPGRSPCPPRGSAPISISIASSSSMIPRATIGVRGRRPALEDGRTATGEGRTETPPSRPRAGAAARCRSTCPRACSPGSTPRRRRRGRHVRPRGGRASSDSAWPNAPRRPRARVERSAVALGDGRTCASVMEVGAAHVDLDGATRAGQHRGRLLEFLDGAPQMLPRRGAAAPARQVLSSQAANPGLEAQLLSMPAASSRTRGAASRHALG